MMNKPEVLELVWRKASMILGRKVLAMVVDGNASPQSNGRMERLMEFGRAHSDIITIKE